MEKHLTNAGRGARPQSNVEQLYQGWNGSPVLTPTKPERLSAQVGMRLSLGGTQVRRAVESHHQDAYIAEVRYGEPVHGKSEDPSLNEGTTRR